MLPAPLEGYWSDRSKNEYAGFIYRCSRNTCRGAAKESGELHDEACWIGGGRRLSTSTTCDPDELLCTPGAEGPLCGSCSSGYVYSATTRQCIGCGELGRGGATFAIGVVVVIAIIALAAVTGRIRLPSCIRRSWLVGPLLQIDSGMARLCWSTFQIIQSAAWSLDMTFPEPYSWFLRSLSWVSFDFLSFECAFKRSNSLFYTVYAWSALPLLVILLNGAVYRCRLWWSRGAIGASSGDNQFGQQLEQQHAYIAVLITYLVLPPVSRRQFQALDCVTVAGGKFLRMDTSVDCDSPEFRSFRVVDACLISVYLSIVVFWLAILLKNRKLMNPWLTDEARSVYLRNMDPKLAAFSFLFQVYRVDYYAFECAEMLRRLLFIGVLPLVSSSSSRRAACGVALALFFTATYREVRPFVRDATNTLAQVASYVVLLTYCGALAISTGLDKNTNPFVFGSVLLGVNLVILGVVLGFGFQKHAAGRQWLRELTEDECELLGAMMEGRGAAADNQHGGDVEMSGSESDDRGLQVKENNKLLKQLLMSPHEVVIDKKIGAGSFGEVFSGSCLGMPVAIKTMHVINEISVQGFRQEILVTSSLRHPCIVGFVGATWSRELTCLILEWMPHGSMGDLLDSKKVPLDWSEPLLRLATDVARGMVYMHGREYVDELTEVSQKCVLHRDLKPDNTLITPWRGAKISDFGTSRARNAGTDMTVVGTPLFAAGEVMRGEDYDESVDVYSFGMILVSMAVREQGIVPFISHRWQAAFQAQTVPDPNSIGFRRVMKCLWDEGWRPFSTNDALPNAPLSMNELAVRCCDHEPAARPSFQDILAVLTGACLEEVEREGPFVGLDDRACLQGATLTPVDSSEDARRRSEHQQKFSAVFLNPQASLQHVGGRRRSSASEQKAARGGAHPFRLSTTSADI
jgi:serine/threonine protein kinase